MLREQHIHLILQWYHHLNQHPRNYSIQLWRELLSSIIKTHTINCWKRIMMKVSWTQANIICKCVINASTYTTHTCHDHVIYSYNSASLPNMYAHRHTQLQHTHIHTSLLDDYVHRCIYGLVRVELLSLILMI